ncbi:MAG: 2'-deoxycytidine 5'-triphosphate deaminase [Acidobacteria bacterium]|nr:2'-deoxycytidine 5'-triphosphate deaminase [Acidobacteriota bacterium]
MEANFHGQATAKSSVGRVDVLARLVVEGMDQYEGFDPQRVKLLKGEHFGEMYLEITPMTFDVNVREGEALSQLRLFYGPPDDARISSEEVYKTILGEESSDGSLGVDLTPVDIRGVQVVAFCARKENSKPIPLWEEDRDEDKPSPCDYWRFVTPDKPNRLRVKQDEFYLLRSKEKISVQKGVAVYCRASDETIGEMRIHYAGFAHPFFGKKRPDKPAGTPLIFEVRGHQVDVSLAHGERMARLIFYRMSEDCAERKADSSIEKRSKNPYQDQSLQLSKFFRDWPPKLERISEDGIVEPA